jgi:hypothetical protein
MPLLIGTPKTNEVDLMASVYEQLLAERKKKTNKNKTVFDQLMEERQPNPQPKDKSDKLSTAQLQKRREAEQWRNINEVSAQPASAVVPSKDKPLWKGTTIKPTFHMAPTQAEALQKRVQQVRGFINTAKDIGDPEKRKNMFEVAKRVIPAGVEQTVAGLANANKVLREHEMANVNKWLEKRQGKSLPFLKNKPLDVKVRDWAEKKLAENDEAINAIKGQDYLKTGYEAVKSGVQMATAALTGPAAPLTFGVTAAGQYAREAEKEGANPKQQALYGGIMGVIEGLTEKIPLGNVQKTFLSPFKQAVVSYLKNIPDEFIQESASELASGLAKQFIYKPDQFVTNGKIDANKIKQFGDQVIEAGKQGAVSATLTGAPGLVVSGARQMMSRPNVSSINGQTAESLNTGIGQQKESVNNLENIPKSDTMNVPKQGYANPVPFKKPTPEQFAEQRDKSPKKEFMTPYKPEQMKDWDLNLTDDGVGYALKPDGDMVGVFNNSGRRGAGEHAVIEAISKGAKTCDAIGGHLASYYKNFGFEETNRVPWDDKEAPEGWNYEKYGRPDVVFLAYPESFSREPGDVAERVRTARLEGSAREQGRSATDNGLYSQHEGPDTGLRGGLDQTTPNPIGQRTGNIGNNVNPTQTEPGNFMPENEIKQPWEMTREEFNENHFLHGTSKENAELIRKEGLIKRGNLIHAGEKNAAQIANRYTNSDKNKYQPLNTSGEGGVFVVSASDENGLLDAIKTARLEGGETIAGNVGENVIPFKFVAEIPSGVEPHKYLVEQALKEGKTISPEVLKEYPELQKQFDATRSGLQEGQPGKQIKTAPLEDYVSGKTELPDTVEELQSILDEVEKAPEKKKIDLDLQFFAKKVRKKLDELRKEYGVIKQGEAPRLRDAQVPQATDAGKTRQFARTAAEILPEESAQEVLKDVENERLAYDPISNKETISKAEQEINFNHQAALKKFRGAIDSQKRITADDIALGEALLTKAAKDGDIKLVGELTVKLAAELTNAGQTVQAARLLKKMSPEGYLQYTQRQIDKFNREFGKKFGDKFKNAELTEDEIKAILDAPTTQRREEIGLKIARRIAQQTPVTFMEKFNTWRRIAMLLNPKTHIRNIVSNALFMPLRKTADSIGTGLERIAKIPEGQRTKAVGWSKDKGVVDAVNKSWGENGHLLIDNGRWDIAKILGKEKRVFKTSWLEKLNKFSGETLNSEDVWFLERAYKDALGQYLKANNAKVPNETAVNYAARKALEATYRDTSKLANLLNRVKRQGGIPAMLTEAALPFTKTPINLTKRAFEYSPLGLTRGLIDAGTKIKSGKVEATQAIEEMAKGLTGTGAMVLGMFLAKIGLLTGANDKDIDKANFEKAVGKQPYAVKIGNSYYTWDWAQPVSVPVAMGVQVYNSLKEKNAPIDTIYNAVAAGGDTLLNTSLYQNVKRLMTGFAGRNGGETQSAANTILDLMTSYVEQAHPTLVNQIAKTVDPTIRTSYVPKGKAGLGYRAEKGLNFLKSRTPGLTQRLPPKVNTLGEVVKQPDNIAARAGLNFLSPGNLSQFKDSEAARVISQIYDETGDKTVFPRTAPKFVTMNKQRYDLTAKEVSQWQQISGQYIKEQIAETDFDFMKSEEKAKAMRNILDDAGDAAKEQILRERGIDPEPRTRQRRRRLPFLR